MTEASFTDVKIEVANGIAAITLDLPPVNALTGRAFGELRDAFNSMGTRRDVNVVVFNATGKHFCAGVDLADSPKRARPDGRAEDGGPKGDPRGQMDPGILARECFWAIYDCAVPVIGAVHGKAIGAGLVMASCCDIVIAAESFEIALTEINVGVLGGVRATQRWLGPHMARRIFFTGEYVGADELYRRGVLEAVVPKEELLETANKLAKTIASKSPIALRLAKESANRVEHMDLKTGYRTEQDYTLRIRRYADSAEAGKAFAERRDPNFLWE